MKTDYAYQFFEQSLNQALLLTPSEESINIFKCKKISAKYTE